MKEIIAKELQEEKMVGLIWPQNPSKRIMLLMGKIPENFRVPNWFCYEQSLPSFMTRPIGKKPITPLGPFRFQAQREAEKAPRSRGKGGRGGTGRGRPSSQGDGEVEEQPQATPLQFRFQAQDREDSSSENSEDQEMETTAPNFLIPDEGGGEEDVFEPAPQGRRRNRTKARRRIQGPSQQSVLDEDWAMVYESSPSFGKIWQATLDPQGQWPEGIKVYNKKLYQGEMLCIPLGLELRVVGDHHLATGHLGVQRMVRDMTHRYKFDSNIDPLKIAKKIKEQCNTCQACEPPTWQAKGPIEMTTLVPRAMASVCIDIFSPPETSWRGKIYNALIVWVDRLSGWIGAIPTQKKGLSAQKCAHLMMERSWDIFGIPSIITSDQGPQFSGKWWRTMCARLGIRQAFSQAHRPQGNGRAEVAGKSLFALLRKMHATQQINWVEALPRAIRLHNNAINDSGLSPYQILFGRDRLEAGLPYQPAQECETAKGYFTHMENVDAEVAKKFNELHKEQ